MEEWKFVNADMSDAVMHRAKNYVDNWDDFKQEVTVKMTNFNTIIDDIFPLADKTEYINALASYQLLIIDDLGVLLMFADIHIVPIWQRPE